MEKGEISEAALAEVLGLSRDRLKKTRAGLQTPKHWSVQGGHVLYTELGFRAVLDLLGTLAGLKKAEASKEAAEIAARALELTEKRRETEMRAPVSRELFDLCVQRSREHGILNNQILLASLGNDWVDRGTNEGLVRVRVPTNLNFILGMMISARHLGGELFELVGRCPRTRGRM